MPNLVTHLGTNIPWRVYRSGQNAFTITFTQSAAAFNISPYTFTVRFRKSKGEADLFTLTQGAGLTNGGASGILTVDLTAAQISTNFPGDHYFYIIEYVVSSKTYALFQEVLTVSVDNPDSTTTSVNLTVSLAGANNISAAITLAAQSHFRGTYVSLVALQTAIPTGNAGDYADVDAGVGTDVQRYIWDDSDDEWVEGAGTGDMDNPMTTQGDIIVGGASGVPQRLAAGSTSGHVLTSNGAGQLPSYQAPSGGGGGTVATDAEVIAGTNNSKFISPLARHRTGRHEFSAIAYGAYADTIELYDGAMTSGSAVLTSATGLFTSADVGKTAYVPSAGSAGAALIATITGFTSSTQVTLASTASATVSGKQFIWGHDDTEAIQDACDAASAVNGTVLLPWGTTGRYLVNGALQTSVGGVNPNCQIFVPASDLNAANRGSIEIIGEGHNVFPYFYSINPDKSGIIIHSTITGSGTNPSVFGTKAPNGGFQNFSYRSIYVQGIDCRFSSNAGTTATMSGFDFQFAATVSMTRCSYGADVPMASTASAASAGTFGFLVSSAQNDGPNVIQECYATSVTHGFVAGEHTQFINAYSLSCYDGLLVLRGNFFVQGTFTAHSCVNAVAFQQGTILGITTGGLSFCKVNLSVEIETNTTGEWYDSVTCFTDTGNFGQGIIRFIKHPGTSTAAITTAGFVVGCTGLSLIPHESMLPRQTNTAGGAITSSTGAGSTTPIIEIGSGVADASSGNHVGTLRLTTNQAGTSHATGAIQFLNSSLGSADKRTAAIIGVTFGATNSGQLQDYAYTANVIGQLNARDRTKHQFFTPIIVDADITPTQLTANTDNYAPTNSNTAAWMRVSSNQAIALSGFNLGATQVDGRKLMFTNIGSFNIFLLHDSTSTAANRILIPGGVRYIVGPGKTVCFDYDGTSSRWRLESVSGIVLLDSTVTAGGTTGAQTIDKPTGTVNFAAGASSLVVTNSLVTTSSLVFCTIRTNDATALLKNVVPGSGSFTITLNAATTAETSVGFLVVN